MITLSLILTATKKMKCNSPSVFQISSLPEVFNRPNFSSAQWDFVKQFLFEYLLIRAVETLGEGRNLGEIQLVVFWPGAGSSECSYTGCTRMSISHWLILTDILMHSIDEHSDEESKIFALRYIMVISHTYVNRQLNILDMIVGYDMSFLFTEKNHYFFSILFDNKKLCFEYKYIFER